MTPEKRITTLDAVRGFAVMGILLMNIVDFGMPSYAYVDPNYYGGATGVNWWTWAVTYVFADGKMRGLFTMMFGASTVLIAERAVASGDSPARVHYARMGVLFVIGMAHAYLVWAGDTLVLYALCGAVAFLAWRWSARALLATGIGLLVLKLAIAFVAVMALADLRSQAARPDASPGTVEAWRTFARDVAPDAQSARAELTAYRGTWREAMRERKAAAIEIQTEINAQALPDTLALLAIGMALFKLGFFGGTWPRRRYRQIAAGGLVATIPLYVPLVLWIDRTAFSPITLVAADAIQLTLLRPWMSLGWASLIILLVTSKTAPWLSERLGAAGRMAFSNYIGTSIVATLFFNGYGFGWYGYLQRWELYVVVAAIWTIILLWSKPWLSRYRYGPMEWVWRSLARWQLQPMRL